MSNLLKSKFFLGALAVTVMFVGAVAVKATPAAADCSITTTLRVGSTGVEVQCLQGKVGATADGKFGPMTAASVKAFQASHGLSADGVVGPLTRAVLNGVVMAGGLPAGCTSTAGYSPVNGVPCNSGATTLPAGCTSTAGYSPVTGMPCSSGAGLPAGCTSTAGFSATTGMSCSGGSSVSTGPLTGGAGSIDDVDNVSSLSDEEVAEGDNDAKVAGYTISADNGSDLAVTAMKLEFEMKTGSGSDNMDDYMDSVSVWQGSTKVGSANVSDFSENNGVYTKTINLSGAVVRANQDSDFFISVDAISNIDGTDLGNNTWTLTLDEVRIQDATGAIITDSSTGDIGTDGATDFSFETVGTATGLELKVTTTTGSSGDAVNKGHVVQVDDTSNTDDVPVLAFDMKATSDIQNIQNIPVKVVASGAGVGEIASGFSLWMNGTQIDTVNAGDTVETSLDSGDACEATDTTCYINFDDVDFNLNDGNTAHMVVKANVVDTGGNFGNGDSLTVSMTSTEVHAIEAEDQNGDDVGTGDLTGTTTAETIGFYTDGITVALNGSPAAVVTAGDATATVSDSGTFTIPFTVTAFGDDVYIDDTAPITAGNKDGSDNATDLDVTGTGTVASTITSPSGATEAGGAFLVEEGTSETFVITTHITATASGFFQVQLGDVLYKLTSAGDGDTAYTFNLADFKTPQVYLNDY